MNATVTVYFILLANHLQDNVLPNTSLSVLHAREAWTCRHYPDSDYNRARQHPESQESDESYQGIYQHGGGAAYQKQAWGSQDGAYQAHLRLSLSLIFVSIARKELYLGGNGTIEKNIR